MTERLYNNPFAKNSWQNGDGRGPHDEFGHTWGINSDGKIFVNPKGSDSNILLDDLEWELTKNQLNIKKMLAKSIKSQTEFFNTLCTWEFTSKMDPRLATDFHDRGCNEVGTRKIRNKWYCANHHPMTIKEKNAWVDEYLARCEQNRLWSEKRERAIAVYPRPEWYAMSEYGGIKSGEHQRYEREIAEWNAKIKKYMDNPEPPVEVTPVFVIRDAEVVQCTGNEVLTFWQKLFKLDTP